MPYKVITYEYLMEVGQDAEPFLNGMDSCLRRALNEQEADGWSLREVLGTGVRDQDEEFVFYRDSAD